MAEEDYEFDPWDTSSGLPDEITVRVENPHFGFNAGMNDGKTCLFILDGTVISGLEEGGDPEFSQWFSVGNGWEPAGKGGARLVREDGKSKKINENSNYGRLFKSLRKAAEAQDLMDAIRKKGTPFDAETWDGLEIFLKRENFSFTDRQTQEKKEASRLNVERIEKVPSAKVSAAAKKEEPAEETEETATVSSKASSNGDAELDAKLKAKLKVLARKVKKDDGGRDAFVEQAFEVDGVLDNAVAEEAVMDEGEASIWVSA